MINEKLKKIKLVITDVDGVLTDGLLHYDANGEAIKSFHVRDGLGVKMLMDAGIQVAVLSGRDSAILRKRISDLGIKLFFLGKLEKESACLDLMKQAGVTAEQTAYIGDDSVDLPVAFLLPWQTLHLMCKMPWIMCLHLEAEKVLSEKCPI